MALQPPHTPKSLAHPLRPSLGSRPMPVTLRCRRHEAVGQEVLEDSERVEALAAGVWQVLIQLAGWLSEGQQVAFAVAEERAALAVSLAGIVARDGHDVAVDNEMWDIDRLEAQSARA